MSALTAIEGLFERSPSISKSGDIFVGIANVMLDIKNICVDMTYPD